MISNRQEEWSHIKQQLIIYQSLEINKLIDLFVGNCQDSIDCVILHGFSDASDSTYAACIYLKYVTKLGESIITFITAKSRITQVEKKLKRMELLGNLILSRLMKRVLCAFQNELFIREYFCCTDSMINIHRIN